MRSQTACIPECSREDFHCVDVIRVPMVRMYVAEEEYENAYWKGVTCRPSSIFCPAIATVVNASHDVHSE